MRIVRIAIAILAGLFLGSLIIYALQPIGHLLFPPPFHYDPADPDMIRKLSIAHQQVVLFPILGAYIAGTFTGSLFTGILSKGSVLIFPMIVGILLFITILHNLLNFYHPVWFWIVSFIFCLFFSLLGGMAARRLKKL